MTTVSSITVKFKVSGNILRLGAVLWFLGLKRIGDAVMRFAVRTVVVS